MNSFLIGIINYVLHSRIKAEEDCPCGSGKQYANCCKNKPDYISKSKKPAEVQVMEMMRSAMIRCCMHPDKINCRGKIKNAHALQNNKILSLLAGSDRHVYTLDAKRQPYLYPMSTENIISIFEVHKTSVNDATTETCFCDYHDSEVFSLIEKDSPIFDENNKRMKFLYAYKAFIFEAYKDEVAYNAFQTCFSKTPSAYQSKRLSWNIGHFS